MHIRENGPKLARCSNTVPLFLWIRLTRRHLEAPSVVEPDPMGSSCQRVDGSSMTFFMYQQAAFTSTVAATVRDGVYCRDHWESTITLPPSHSPRSVPVMYAFLSALCACQSLK